MMVTSGSDPERRRRASVGEAEPSCSASRCWWALASYTGSNALNPSGGSRRSSLGITPPLPSAWSSMSTLTWYCSHSDNSAVPVNPRADTPDRILDGARQHLVGSTTDIIAEQLADIIAEQ